MPFDYTEFLDLADELISEFGRQIQIWEDAEAALPLQTVTAVNVELRNRDLEGSQVQGTLRRYLIAAKGNQAVEVDQYIRDGLGTFTISAVREIKPGPVLLYWDVVAYA